MLRYAVIADLSDTNDGLPVVKSFWGTKGEAMGELEKLVNEMRISAKVNGNRLDEEWEKEDMDARSTRVSIRLVKSSGIAPTGQVTLFEITLSVAKLGVKALNTLLENPDDEDEDWYIKEGNI